MRQFHLYTWNIVTRNMVHREMEVRDLRAHNRSLFLKWHWRFDLHAIALWKTVVTTKYGIGNRWCTNSSFGIQGNNLSGQINFGNFRYKNQDECWWLQQILLWAWMKIGAITPQRTISRFLQLLTRLSYNRRSMHLRLSNFIWSRMQIKIHISK